MNVGRTHLLLQASGRSLTALAALLLVLTGCADEASPPQPGAIDHGTQATVLPPVFVPSAPLDKGTKAPPAIVTPTETPTAEEVAPPTPSDWYLEVLAGDGAPIAGAAVTVSGVTRHADEDGIAAFYGLPRGQYTARVDAPGFAEASATTRLGSGVAVASDVRLLADDADYTFKASTWSVVKVGAVTVTIPPGAFVDAEGQVAMGTLEIAITALDPTGERAYALPGRLLGLEAGATEPVALAPISLVRVAVFRDGERLTLRPGKSLTLQLPVPTGLSEAIGGAMPDGAFVLDAEAGLWRADDEALVERVPDAELPTLRLKARVEGWHGLFWTWADAPTDCVVVHAHNALGGAPLPGTVVRAASAAAPVAGVPAELTGYVGWLAEGTTDLHGNTCIPIPREAEARVVARHALLPFQPAGPATVHGNGLEGTAVIAGAAVRETADDGVMDLAACVAADIALDTPVCVQGRVRDERGEAVSDAAIRVRWHTGFGPVAATTTSDADGVWVASTWGHLVEATTAGAVSPDVIPTTLLDAGAQLSRARRTGCVEMPPLVVPALAE